MAGRKIRCYFNLVTEKDGTTEVCPIPLLQGGQPVKEVQTANGVFALFFNNICTPGQLYTIFDSNDFNNCEAVILLASEAVDLSLMYDKRASTSPFAPLTTHENWTVPLVLSNYMPFLLTSDDGLVNTDPAKTCKTGSGAYAGLPNAFDPAQGSVDGNLVKAVVRRRSTATTNANIWAWVLN